MHKPNWDDLRFILAVAETGSVSQAARQLNVNHATVLRRVSEFEHRHGTVIFEKTTRGYRVLADKRDVIKAAKSAEAAIHAVETSLGGQSAELKGKTRVTSTDTFCQLVLPKIVADLQRSARGLFVEVINANAHVDLAFHRIDVSIRPTLNLPDDLEGETVSELGFAVYAVDPAVEKWIGCSGPVSRSSVAIWQAETIAQEDIVGSADSFQVMHGLAAAGCGRAILPCFVGDKDARLQRLDVGMPHFKVPIWVASHVELSMSPRVRILRNALSEALAEMAGELRGD